MEVQQHKNRVDSITGRLDVEFWDLSYSTPAKNGRKYILKSISGHFRAGELTALMGPSGAGKSTLMNILMGTLRTNVTGSILVNGQPRDMGRFNRQTVYITQEDLLQPHITVQEFMMVAANLKISSKYTKEEKQARVKEVLTMLGLHTCVNTITNLLSGGQRKRLSVALELVSNPPVIFLDEPTTGLDSHATKQMMEVLSLLAEQGRTVVCSIHQPAASLFNQFSQIYVLARGQCVYQGEPRDLVPFLEDSGLHCPLTYNPADFILEVVQGENAENIILLAGEMLNGKLNWRPSSMERDAQRLQCEPPADDRSHKVKVQFAVNSFTQFYVLLCRMLLQQFRNRIALGLQILYNVGISTFVGLIYYQMGNNAKEAFTNFRCLLVVNVSFMYSSMVIPTLTYPTQVRILQKEYLNRWYGLKPYFAAQMLASMPAQVIFGLIYTTIAYLLVGYPLEFRRLALFIAFALVTSFVSEGHGLVAGTILNEVNSSIIAPTTMAPLIAISVMGMGMGKALQPILVFVQSASYLRHSLVGLTLAVYGLNRSELECHEYYCHYQEPKMLLRDLGMEDDTILMQFAFIFGFYVFYRVLAYIALRYRLSLEFSLRLHNFVHRILHLKSSF